MALTFDSGRPALAPGASAGMQSRMCLASLWPGRGAHRPRHPACRLAALDRATGPRQRTDPHGPGLQPGADSRPDPARLPALAALLEHVTAIRAPACRFASSCSSPWRPWRRPVGWRCSMECWSTAASDNWFSQRVQTVVENSATVARSYVEEQSRYIQDHVTPDGRRPEPRRADAAGEPDHLQPLPGQPGFLPRLPGGLSDRPRRPRAGPGPRRRRPVPW